MFVWTLIIIAAIFLDQITKWLTVINLDLGESFPLIQDVFHFTYVQNRGAAFGILKDHRWVFLVISSLAIVVMLIMLWKSRKDSRLLCIALSMIIGGGIGNMIDRVRLGYVVDFIDFYAFDFWVWVFNIADSCVCVGAGLLILYLVIDIVKDSKKTIAERTLEKDIQKSESGEDSQNG